MTEVRIICDDPRHARAKVAKIATVIVHPDGGWTEKRPDTRRLERAEIKVDSGAVHHAEAFMAAAFGMGNIRCKLCGRRLPRRCGVAFGRAMVEIARSGEKSVRLSELAAIIRSMDGLYN